MITRPLDLSSRLSTPKADWDWLFFVNGGLLVLFFLLFGSRFILAPGLGTDFAMASVPSSKIGYFTTTHHISVKRGGLIFTESGQLSLAQLHEWLRGAVSTVKEPVLLVRASAEVSVAELTEISTVAREAGFKVVLGAESVREPAGSTPAPLH